MHNFLNCQAQTSKSLFAGTTSHILHIEQGKKHKQISCAHKIPMCSFVSFVHEGFASATGESFFSMECAFSTQSSIPRSIQQSIVSLLFPIMVASTFSLLWVTLCIFKAESASYLLRHVCVTVLSVFYVFYINITENAVKIFNCTSIDDGCKYDDRKECTSENQRYWVEDTDVMCWRQGHFILMIIVGIPMLMLVSLGLPLWLWTTLRVSRNYLDDAKVLGIYGFLYQSYTSESVYWEIVILLRKALLAIISVYAFNMGSFVPSLLAMGVTFCACMVHSWQRPFATHSPNLNAMEMLSIFASFFVFFFGVLFNEVRVKESKNLRNAISVVMISGLIIVTVWFFISLLSAILASFKLKLGQNIELIKLNTTTFEEPTGAMRSNATKVHQNEHTSLSAFSKRGEGSCRSVSEPVPSSR